MLIASGERKKEKERGNGQMKKRATLSAIGALVVSELIYFQGPLSFIRKVCATSFAYKSLSSPILSDTRFINLVSLSLSLSLSRSRSLSFSLFLSLFLSWQRRFQNRGAQIYIYITLSDHRLDVFSYKKYILWFTPPGASVNAQFPSDFLARELIRG
jgi:hypothetical protein